MILSGPLSGFDTLLAPKQVTSAGTACFHGHAHHGRPKGRTQYGVPVYNVALSLLQRSYPELPPFRLLEVSAAQNGPALGIPNSH
jgi:hypothetical protein